MIRSPAIAAIAFMVLPFGVAFAQGGTTCTFYLDPAEFRIASESHGKFTKGIETFEEAMVDTAGKNCFPAPLGPNPSPPIFPNGLEVTNLIIQDNITPGPNPPLPNPSGDPCALYAIGSGFIGSNSKKVGEDLFLRGVFASLDLIFTEPNHTGVGFKLSRFQGFPGGGWHVSVFNKANELMGETDVNGPTSTEPFKEFFGVWCQQTIGRINIYDLSPVPAPDAIDDIELWEEIPQGCTVFFDQTQFENFNHTTGKFVKGIETFEEAAIVPGGKNCFPAPLGPSPNKDFPYGLDVRNILIQDNITPGPNPPAPNPSNDPCALYVIGGGFIGSNSVKVGEDLFLQGINASLDLIFTEPNHTGVGFKLSRFQGFPTGGWHITAYNKAGEPIAKVDVGGPTANEPFKEFFGIWCGETLGRINIWDAAGPAPDAIDDIELWQEGPTPTESMSWGKLKVIYRK